MKSVGSIGSVGEASPPGRAFVRAFCRRLVRRLSTVSAETVALRTVAELEDREPLIQTERVRDPRAGLQSPDDDAPSCRR